jgi:arylsulfatase
MTDKAIAWVQQQKALTPDQPFFVYFAPGATHAPHHVPKEWADRYKGQFDKGWDAVREETFARQKQLGVIPQEAELTKRHEQIPAWDEMDEKLKPVLARQMEVYAGFLSYTDHHIGRLIDALAGLDVLDNTLIYLIIGDNGASAEGGINGTLNEITVAEAPGMETPEYLLENIDKFGTPEAYNHYAVGWAHAMCTPYQWTKQVASHWGGTRNGTIVHWPNGIQTKGQIRSQFHHIIDVAPTVLEAAGLPEPTLVNGISQEPMHGASMTYSFEDAAAAERHTTQYFEMLCNRGIYHNGWSAVTKHRTPWEVHGAGIPFDDDVWELYDGSTDWTQARNLAKEQPQKLAELQRLFLIEAGKYNALPLDDRVVERLNPELAGRPQLIEHNSQVLFRGMGSLNENCMLNTKNKSHSITAALVIPDGDVNGVIVNQGGITGGWVFYVKDGRLAYHYSFLGVQRAEVVAGSKLPAGEHQVRMEFAYDGDGLGKGGTATLFVDGVEAGSTRVEKTHAFNFSLDETTDVGRDTGAPVCSDYKAGDNAFTGTIKWVRLDIGADSHDHLIDPAQVMHFAMSRQ